MPNRAQQNGMNQDLRRRIIPAVLYVIIIALCTLMGTITSIMLIQIFAILCYYEFIRNSLPEDQRGNGTLGKLLVAVIVISAILINFLKSSQIWNFLISICVLTFFINAYYVIVRHSSLFNNGNLILRTFIYLSLPFLAACYLLLSYETFHEVLLGIFIITWLNDAGAYFVGKAIGKNKISPKVSPGKSWEGWIGGLIIGGLSTLIISTYLSDLELIDWIYLAIIVGVMGLIGDLVESSWKRKLGIKDSGNLMPGHGGFLDRLDSFIYSIPFVALYLLNFAN